MAVNTIGKIKKKHPNAALTRIHHDLRNDMINTK